MNMRYLVMLCAILCAPLATADVMVMKNGSRIVGKLVSGGGGKIMFDTPWGGTLEVKSENVASINTDSTDNTVLMADGEIFRNKRIYADEEQLIVQREGGPERRYAINEIDLVNPEPWKLGDGYRFSGRSSLAFEAERGNSETDEWDADYRMEWRSLQNRFTTSGRLEYDEANNNKVTDNWEVRNQYDYFPDSKNSDNYYGAKLRFEYDRFADLDLRTLVGPHVGREWLNNKYIELDAEIGLVYVDEQFDVAEDTDYYGSLIEFRAESGILGFGTTLFMLHDTTLNFDEFDEPLSNTTLGLRMPLIYGFETAFQARWEYYGGAPDDVDTTDSTYTFRIGYAW